MCLSRDPGGTYQIKSAAPPIIARLIPEIARKPKHRTPQIKVIDFEYNYQTLTRLAPEDLKRMIRINISHFRDYILFQKWD